MTELSDKMRRLADTGHASAEELRDRAAKFDEAAAGFYADPQTVPTPKFLGAWARARRAWCDASGESLI